MAIIQGTSGDDIITGSPDLTSTVIGLDGNDFVELPGFSNIVFEGNGNDQIVFNGDGFNTVYAGDGTDTVTFSPFTYGNRAYLGFGSGDVVNGGSGQDFIVAPGDHALINGNGGGDIIMLGGRHDQVIEMYGNAIDGLDHVYAFRHTDHIVLEDFGKHPDWHQGPHGVLWVCGQAVVDVVGHHLTNHDLIFA